MSRERLNTPEGLLQLQHDYYIWLSLTGRQLTAEEEAEIRKARAAEEHGLVRLIDDSLFEELFDLHLSPEQRRHNYVMQKILKGEKLSPVEEVDAAFAFIFEKLGITEPLPDEFFKDVFNL